MKKKTKNTQSKNTSQYYVPDIFMKIFVYGIGLLYTMSVVMTIWQFVVQYSQNTEVGGWYGYFVTSLLMPMLLFLLTFLLNPRKIRILDKCFESIMFTIVAVIAWSLIIQYFPVYIAYTSKYVEDYARYQIISSLIFTLFYAGSLYILRVTKKWK